MGKKSTKAETLKRKEIVKELLADGHPRGQIIKYAKDTWGICENQTDMYIAQCNADFEACYKERMEIRYGRALKRTTQFYLKMKQKGNDPCAASALKELNEIEGVKIKRVDHSGVVKQEPVKYDLSKLTLAELKTYEKLISKIT